MSEDRILYHSGQPFEGGVQQCKITQRYADQLLASILPILLSLQILFVFDSISVQKSTKVKLGEAGQFGGTENNEKLALRINFATKTTFKGLYNSGCDWHKTEQETLVVVLFCEDRGTGSQFCQKGN